MQNKKEIIKAKRSTHALTSNLSRKNITKSKRSQVTIFIIIAMIIIAGVVAFFVLRDKLFQPGIPADIEPVYNSFLSCLEEEVLIGIDVLESQGGYIYLPEFEPGSDYMPFSSQLKFAGNSIPYWYYVSQNGMEKEQVPSKLDMEEHLEKFIEDKIVNCDKVFKEFYEQGFEVEKASTDDTIAKVEIGDKSIHVNLDMDLSIRYGEQTTRISNHKLKVKSELGRLYDTALDIYEYEQDELFLENYNVDVLRLYAPVDGVELSCSPKTWLVNEVFDELQSAIEANTLSLKVQGREYDLRKKEYKYFVIKDLNVDANMDVRFINSRNWPYSFEVNPSEGAVLIAQPVGNQPGLGILGFCYIPYHFVYDVKYPVLIQVSYGKIDTGTEETFQFPVAVVIQRNMPRKALDISAAKIELPELCDYKNTPVRVSVYDTKLSPIDAQISFECFGTKCNIGLTENGKLSGMFPQCVNGYILARAPGFVDGKYLYSTTQAGNVEMFLDKLYALNIDLRLDNRAYNGEAIISFDSSEVDFEGLEETSAGGTGSKTILWPEQRVVELSEGQYEVSVHIYRGSQLSLEGQTKQQCIEVPISGFLGGLSGLTKEKCFDIEIPSQVISNVLAGGGKQNYYIVESELEGARTIEINAQSLPVPNTIEQLQENYILWEEKRLDIWFR